MTAQKRERKKELIRSSLQATNWNSDEYGIAVQAGIEDAIDDLNQIAKWMYDNQDRELIAVDNLKHQKDSFLSGLKAQGGAHYHVPATMQGNIRLYTEAPELHFPILFLHVATNNRADIEPLVKYLRPGAIVLGSVSACRMVLETAQCEAQPLYFHGESLSVRVVA